MFVFPAPYVPASATVTFHDSNTSTAETISVSGLVQAGDLIVLFDRAADPGAAPTLVTPSGFTNIYSASSTSPGHRIAGSYKISNGTETTLTGMTGGLGPQKIVTIFRGSSAISAVNVVDVAQEATNDNPASQVCNASGGTPPLIVFGYYCSGSTVSPRTFSPSEDGELNISTFVYAKYKIYNSAPADTTIDMDDEGSGNGLASFYIECTLT